MSRKKHYIIILTIFILSSLIFTFALNVTPALSENTNKKGDLNPSSILEGADNLEIIDMKRRVNVSNHGLVDIKEFLTFENLNDFPIETVYVGIPINLSDNLMTYKAVGEQQQTLKLMRENLIIEDYELFTIHLNSPLLPEESRVIKFFHQYKNILQYIGTQQIKIEYIVYPLVPYKMSGYIQTTYKLPSSAQVDIYEWGVANPPTILGTFIDYNLEEQLSIEELEPFLANIEDRKLVTIVYNDSKVAKMEINELNREIHISPWGTIKIQEEYSIENFGPNPITSFSLEIPGTAENIYIFDDLGEIKGTQITETVRNTTDLLIRLTENRIRLTKDSKFEFTLQYTLPFTKYYSANWFQQSIKINLLPTDYEFYTEFETTKVYLKGINQYNYISEVPDAIDKSHDSIILIYHFDEMGPSINKVLVVSYPLNLFYMLLRPIIFILLFASISSLLVLYIKTRSEKEDLTSFRKENIPTTEIREFCSLYDEMNALILEMRRAEEEVKRKKISKKKYRNIIDKNNSRIENIKKELKPFKKELIETGETFENIVKKLEVLEAERISIDDGLKLLQTRYRRGKLPSKGAYEKLLNNFLKRRKKVDRTIDKFIQQLRSYLI